MYDDTISLMSIFIDVFNGRFELVKTFYATVVEESMQYTKDTSKSITAALVVYLLFCICVYSACVYFKITNWNRLKAAKRVLFVIAHPDDECMFFGPLILSLSKLQDCQLHLLCLSNGNYNNLGNLRKQELWNSCMKLGIPDSNITMYRNDLMPDDPSIRWRVDIVAEVILYHIKSLSIDTVITFDKIGVSKHQNHVSIYYAIALLFTDKHLPMYCKVYALESINVLRKYSWILDVPLSFLLSTYCYILPINEHKTLRMAMAAHESQYVWFRKLYMMFSRYTVINTLREIELVDLELDLQLDD